MHCTSLSSCCGIVSKHMCMYQLLLHKMAPVCMKITKNFLGEDPRPPGPFNHNCLRYYYILKFKHPFTYTLYAHTGTLQVCKIFTNYMENPSCLLFKEHSYPLPPPHPRLNDPGHSVYPPTPPPPFQNFVADENKYFGIEIPVLWRMKINFT